MCEFEEVYDGIEVGRKMAVVAKLGRNIETKPLDKQTEVEDKTMGLAKREVELNLQKLKPKSKGKIRHVK